MADNKFIPFNNQRHGKYIVELKHGYSAFALLEAPQMVIMGAKDIDNANFGIGITYIDKPFKMINEGEKQDFEQYYLFIGGDSSKFGEFDADIEFGLEGKINKISYPACVRTIPGLVYGPLDIKKVNKPFVFMHIVISPTPAMHGVPIGTLINPMYKPRRPPVQSET